MFLFTRPKSRAHLSAVPPALQRLMSDVPGTIAFALKMSIFSRDIMGSRAINVDVIGPTSKFLPTSRRRLSSRSWGRCRGEAGTQTGH